MPGDNPDELVRDSRMTRARTTETARTEVWAKAAGRCTLCSQYLVGQTGYFHTTLVGQLAHITGATTNAGSPRGDSDLGPHERATAANLMLLCYKCHRRVDSRGMADYYDEASLIRLKDFHEHRVRDATDFATLSPTMVLKLAARIRGVFTPATDRQVSESLRALRLVPGTDDPRDARVDVSLPDSEDDEWSWDRARASIKNAVETIRERGASYAIGTTAVFAIGPIPVLALVGYYLDDKSDVRVMPASRRDDDSRWMWPADPAGEAVFANEQIDPDAHALDVLIIVNVSGSVDRHLIPDTLRNAPTIVLSADQLGPEVVRSQASVSAFALKWRALMAEIESMFPSARHIHVVAAIPATLAVEIGRAYMKDAQAELVVYQRRDDAYFPAVTLA